MTVLGYFYLQNGKFDKALILFKALNELFPDDPYLMKSLSYAFLVNGEYENALHLTERLLQDAPTRREDDVGYLLRSKSLWGLGREDEARDLLKQFLRLREGTNEAETR